MQPEGPTSSCPFCLKSINNFILKPFDRSDIIPSSTNKMAVHIPVLGQGTDQVYSYWLSYRAGYGESRVGLSIHVARFYMFGQFGAQFESINFDAFGNTTGTEDSFVLPNTCYHIQPPGLLMDIDPSSVEQIQPIVCVDNIDVGNSITISVSFFNRTSVPPSTIDFKSAGKLECSIGGSNSGEKTLDMSGGQKHLVEYVGSGIDGSVTFSVCQSAGPRATTKVYFYDS
jgi:hypothetical protein